MAFQPLLPAVSRQQHPRFKKWQTGKSRLNGLMPFLSLPTWLLIGACLQSCLVLVVPSRYSVLPALGMLAWKLCDTVLMTKGWKHNHYMDGVIPKKFSAQIPDSVGRFHSEPAAEKIVVFFLAFRNNHPMGLLAPGFKEIGEHSTKMYAELEAGAPNNGFLGSSNWIRSDTSSPVLNQISYWRSYEDVHAFAHGATHRQAWKWWDATLKEHDYFGIAHELYSIEPGQYENIYVNFQPTLLGATTYLKRGDKFEKGVVDDMWLNPIVDASRGRLRTSKGRRGTRFGDGTEHEKYGANIYA